MNERKRKINERIFRNQTAIMAALARILVRDDPSKLDNRLAEGLTRCMLDTEEFILPPMTSRQEALAGEFVKEGHSMEDAIRMAKGNQP